MNVMGCFDNDYQPIGLMEMKGSTLKGYSVNFGEGRAARPFNGAHCGDGSEDDDLSFMEDGNGENCIGAKDEKGSPRQRMKWTDNVVRVLIAVVDRVGDDSTFDGMEGLKEKIWGSAEEWQVENSVDANHWQGGVMFSPQQCEDKFGDLNKEDE
ncbi:TRANSCRIPTION FACTOR TRIHELIX FAMILY-RELATED [Salix koriyanagi]|uniref:TRANSCRIPTION FACTOR TRIHELIX FAMILY-RELATED n=1 Tax=Salix koriyanagi TaxID=2511006 RepID=A0A9Q0PVC6_9ROSI|nr:TRANSCRIPTION FACTOR TRIHELIX FAMILY-RELATED [Salix koriyanagi]